MKKSSEGVRGQGAAMCVRQHYLTGVLLVLMSIASTANVFAEAPPNDARLCEAARAGDLALVKEALAEGADSNMRCPFGRSLLMTATMSKNLETVQLLLSYGANPKLEGNEGILFVPIEAGRLDILDCLVKAGASVNVELRPELMDDYLVDAVQYGKVEIVKYLLDSAANPNGRSAITDGTALHLAASKGNLEMIQLLIAHGADVNLRDRNGMTPLMYACGQGHLTAVEALLAAKADPNVRNNWGLNAKTLAERVQNPDASELPFRCAGNGGKRAPVLQ